MDLRVRRNEDGHELDGEWAGVGEVNAFLRHLGGRGFSPATVRAYAYDVLGFARFLIGGDLPLARVRATDIFDVDRRPGRAPAREHGQRDARARRRPRSTGGSPPSGRSSNTR